MISVLLVRNKCGEFCSCSASGHAGFAAIGSDIVCSAVTVLLRTTMQVLSETAGVALTAQTHKRGTLEFGIEKKAVLPELTAKLVYAADFLETGIAALANEYPQHVALKMQHC
ncbi:MAG: ribosomal-processing cysteine protease Prp [Treponema sp.]|nr:ribosomal-processing cysteine protease Prp [Treponema sp.]